MHTHKPSDGGSEREADHLASQALRGPASRPRASLGDAHRLDDAPSIVRDVVGSAGAPLDSQSRSFFEPRFGHSFAHVRVHVDPLAAVSAHAVNAAAYTAGSHIVFGRGRYAPATTPGRRLLAHELAHVAQQGGTCHPAMVQHAPLEEGASATLPTPAEIACMLAGKAADQIFNYAVSTVHSIRAKKAVRPELIDRLTFQALVALMPETTIKRLERELLLWPIAGRMEVMTELIEITTGALRLSDREESERGRFDVDAGSKTKDAVSDKAIDVGKKEAERAAKEGREVKDQCLNFLYESVGLLVPDADRGARARKAYDKGARDRRETDPKALQIRTGSRLASELRLQGMVGPATILTDRRPIRSRKTISMDGSTASRRSTSRIPNRSSTAACGRCTRKRRTTSPPGCCRTSPIP